MPIFSAGLRALCDAAGIDESHGVKHARAVLAHAERALAAAPPLPPMRALALRLAALLHDADDAKYFPATATHTHTMQTSPKQWYMLVSHPSFRSIKLRVVPWSQMVGQ